MTTTAGLSLHSIHPPSHDERGRRPILVTGAPRSGTTWVGTVIDSCPQTGYIHEPFNVRANAGICRAGLPSMFAYLCADNGDGFVNDLQRTLDFDFDLAGAIRRARSPRDLGRAALMRREFDRHRRRHAQPLVKDPVAFFSAEWLASRFDMNVIVLIRHPAAIASSLKRLGWRFPFSLVLDQPLLIRDHLRPFKAEIHRLAEGNGTILAEASLLWRLVYYTAKTYRERHPNWLFLRHEDMSREPIAGFGQVFQHCGLSLCQQTLEMIRTSTSPDNPESLSVNDRHGVRLDSRTNVHSWKRRLTEEEIAEVRDRVGELGEAFYAPSEW